MKSVCRILALISCLSCTSHPGNRQDHPKFISNEEKIIVTADLLATYSNYGKRDNNYYYLIEIKLINHTDEVCEFYTLSCGSLVNIITDADQATFLYHNCTDYFPNVIELKPEQEYSVTAILIRNKYIKGFTPSGRFGFVIDKPKKKFGKYIARTNNEIVTELKLMRQKQESVVWSDPVVLTATNFNSYKIRNIVRDSSGMKYQK
jgi:hypothetical protein